MESMESHEAGVAFNAAAHGLDKISRQGACMNYKF
jgi:hypothetical protein